MPIHPAPVPRGGSIVRGLLALQLSLVVSPSRSSAEDTTLGSPVESGVMEFTPISMASLILTYLARADHCWSRGELSYDCCSLVLVAARVDVDVASTKTESIELWSQL